MLRVFLCMLLVYVCLLFQARFILHVNGVFFCMLWHTPRACNKKPFTSKINGAWGNRQQTTFSMQKNRKHAKTNIRVQKRTVPGRAGEKQKPSACQQKQALLRFACAGWLLACSEFVPACSAFAPASSVFFMTMCLFVSFVCFGAKRSLLRMSTKMESSRPGPARPPAFPH